VAKIKLEFDTEKDQKQDIRAAVSAGDLALCIWAIQSLMRNKREYSKTLSADAETLIDEIHETISNEIGSIDDYTY
jgi:hypothetical protein